MLYDFLSVDKTSDTLLYEQLYDNIKTAIGSGFLKKGDKLPSIRGLSEDMAVSRTTVETAYEQLLAEGYIVNQPRSGYYVEAEQTEFMSLEKNYDGAAKAKLPETERKTSPDSDLPPVKYDFSSSSVDPACTDIKFWQRCIKDVLEKPYVISSYGVPRGEPDLCSALCEYSRRVRGVKAEPDRIVVGAGTQTLLSVLLPLLDDYGSEAAMEKGFFPQGEQIFSDFRYDITPLTADKSGIILGDDLKSRVVFVNSSGSIRGSAPIPINKRAALIRWAEKHDAVIIEDDFNGELRCMSKPVPALQGMCSDRVVYIGSFSKLLLPSVRISYMVLPPALAQMYSERMEHYNQTSSKAEQLALAHYIFCGRLDRQLRRLRKLYAEKAMLMYNAVKKEFPPDTVAEIIETALSVRIKLRVDGELSEIKAQMAENGIRPGKCREKNGLKYFYLSFAGIPKEKIGEAIRALAQMISANYYSDI